MTINLDPSAGFCSGVKQAVRIAENELLKERPLYCLGEIVHNEQEVERLRDSGLVFIDHARFKTLKHCKVLIRAHGEPPETYRIAMENNITLIDASCPVVMHLQQDVLMGYREMKAKKGQVVIFGKKGHAEVMGLEGQAGGDAIVIRNIQDLDAVDPGRPVRLFSQTTMDVSGLYNMASQLEARLGKHAKGGSADFKWKDSICRQVSNRSEWLKEFAARHEVVVFVSGRKSSNGSALYTVCLEANPRTFFVSSGKELRKEWFEGVKDAGITGATSTPLWQIKSVAEAIMNLAKEKDVPQEIDPGQF